MIVFSFIVARKHGETKGLPLVAAFDAEGWPALLEKYNELSSSAEFGNDFAEVQVWRNLGGDNTELYAHHIYPDPSQIEKARKAKLLAEARAIRERNAAAGRALDLAKDKAKQAKESVQELTNEQKDLLAEFDLAEEDRLAKETAAKRQAVEDSQAEVNRMEKAGKKLGQQQEQSIAEGSTQFSEVSIISAPVGEDDLDAKNEEDLRAIGQAEGIDLSDAKTSAELVEQIRYFRRLGSLNTVDALKTIATAEDTDLGGSTDKTEILNKILKARRAKATPPLPPIQPPPLPPVAETTTAAPDVQPSESQPAGPKASTKTKPDKNSKK